jgi:hypothetical protein
MNMDFLGAACFGVMSLAFALLRLRRNIFVSAFNIACAGVMVCYFLQARWKPEADEWLVLTAGLFLYWFGLFTVRIMLQRSVSLNLLVRLSRGEAGNTVGEDIAGRLRDMQTYGMVKKNGEDYSLKAFGGFMSFWVRLLYSILRLER